MNATTTTLYDDYLKLTNGDIAAAASLVLADALYSSIDAKTPAQTVPDAMLSLKQAAAYLCYRAEGLREILERTRRSRAGQHVVGPTIEFSQSGKGGSIRFRREWLDAFIEAHRVQPGRPALPKVREKSFRPETAMQRRVAEWNALCKQ
jgi:hypothetical protein